MRNILFVASESVPFIKTGGLADVVGSLPKAFPKDEFDVRVIIPNYMCIPWELRSQFRYVHHFYMDMGLSKPSVYVGIMTYELDGITYYFIDNEHYFGGGKPYGELLWDIEKFCYFSKAALAILPVVNFHPDIIHCHDWQASLIPVYLRTVFKDHGFFWKTRTILTIHNLKFQGIWDVKTMQRFTGLPAYVFTPGGMEYKRDANMLKGGIVYADYVTTVSNTYASEVQTGYFGEGLDGVLRGKSHSFCGIVNGIDYDMYNPETDIHLVAKYNVKSFRKLKPVNKKALQQELGLPVDEKKFMIGIISRLTDQKGLDLVACVMEQIVDPNAQFVVIGTGDAQYENLFRHYQWRFPDRVSANIFFSNERANKLYASADAILMPSRFEPCGLTQLIALRYGTVPIVRETGGLKDTVEPYNEFAGTGTGFSFANYNAHEMLNTINYAKKVFYEHRNYWNRMVDRGMTADFSWKKSAISYADLYRWIMSW